MPFKIVRNDLVKMEVDVIVNTANEEPIYSTGTDTAVYKAAGEEELLEARRKIGFIKEGDVGITPGFQLPVKYIIHAVSPRYIDGKSGEEEKLRSCYRKSLMLAYEKDCKSIAFPLIATGGFGYPKEEGMSIAVDEIHRFLLQHKMMVYLVVFDTKATELALRLQPALDAYIDHHYICEKRKEEYGDSYFGSINPNAPGYDAYKRHRLDVEERTIHLPPKKAISLPDRKEKQKSKKSIFDLWKKEEQPKRQDSIMLESSCLSCEADDYYVPDESALEERISHLSDTFQQYLFYLIESKGMSNPEVYNRSLITKQTFSKIKNNPNYQPEKSTAMRLCIGAKLSLDETIDLLARAGYALSPCDKRDIIFKFYIEHEAYDIYALDISLEEHGLPCFIQ